MSRLLIRTMLAEDAPAVSELDALCIPTPWSTETWLAEIRNSVGYYRVAETEGELIGYAGCHIVLDEAHVLTIGVRPDARRRRIGERLLVDLLGRALHMACVRLTLEVREGNVAAQRLYRKYGFSPVSRRRRYYSDNDEDALVMWVEDASRPGFRALFAERAAELESGQTAGVAPGGSG